MRIIDVFIALPVNVYSPPNLRWVDLASRLDIRDRGWQKMRAAKKNSVYCIRDEFLNSPAPTLIQGLHALAVAIHPEDFPQPPGLRCISEKLVSR
jgi:hypothetical protein